LDIIFGKWKVKSVQGSVEWIILKWIYKKYDGEAMIVFKTRTDGGIFKMFWCITGSVQYRECCEWLGNLVFGVITGAVQYSVVSGWGTVSFLCNCGCCTVQRLLCVAGRLSLWCNYGCCTVKRVL
jgi:hypothetical protein